MNESRLHEILTSKGPFSSKDVEIVCEAVSHLHSRYERLLKNGMVFFNDLLDSLPVGNLTGIKLIEYAIRLKLLEKRIVNVGGQKRTIVVWFY